MNQRRQPRFTPTGGQFAPDVKAGPDVSLGSAPGTEQDVMRADAERFRDEAARLHAEQRQISDVLDAHDILRAHPDAAYLTISQTAVGPVVTALTDHRGRNLGEAKGMAVGHTFSHQVRRLARGTQPGVPVTIDLPAQAHARRGLLRGLRLMNDKQENELRARNANRLTTAAQADVNADIAETAMLASRIEERHPHVAAVRYRSTPAGCRLESAVDATGRPVTDAAELGAVEQTIVESAARRARTGEVEVDIRRAVTAWRQRRAHPADSEHEGALR